MFKTKGFSSNNSLKRRAVIVDAPDLPPEEAEFFITNVGIADTETAEMPEDTSGFEVASLYEDVDEDRAEVANDTSSADLTQVKGIGTGMAENLREANISSVQALINASPADVASKVSGASISKVKEWQANAKSLVNA
jgi:predicted flap endonuclease-1-like 5' DNA nuclease